MSQLELQSAQSSQSVSSLETSSEEGHNGGEFKQTEADKPLPDKVRIYDLAKEMGRENAEVMDTCKKLGIPFKTHSSTISGQEADQVRETLDTHPPAPQAAGDAVAARKELRPPQAKPQIRRVEPPKTTAADPERVSLEERATATPQIVGLRKPTPKPKNAAVTAEAGANSTQLERTVMVPNPSPAEQPSLVGPPPRRAEESAKSSPQPPQGRISPAVAPSSVESASTGDTAEEVALGEPLAAPTPAAPEAKTPDPAPLLTQPTRPSPPPKASRPDAVKPVQAKASPLATSARETLASAPSSESPPRSDRKKAAPVAPKPQLAGPPTRPVLKKPEPEDGIPADQEDLATSDGALPDGASPDMIAPDRVAAERPRPSTGDNPDQSVVSLRPKRPRPTQAPRPQLVGPPVRPEEKVAVSLEARERPTRRKPGESQEAAGRDSVGLVSPPVRPTRPDAPDAPRPPSRVKRRSEIDEEEDAKLAGPKRGTRGTAKRKRSRRGGEDVEAEGVETTVLSAAKLAELNALKPLPRPAAPPSNKPAATVAPPAPSRPRPTHNRQRSHQAQTPKDEGPSRPTSIQIQGNLTVQELADLMQIPATDIIRVLFMKGSMVNINQVLDVSLIESVAKELECDVEVIAAESEAKKTEMLDIGDIEYLQFRPPVVTIMGHVDHGKTTLLDAIRKTSVVSGEAGGITQRIGAYHVDVTHEGALNRVVFLDTPGHEAFTAMRARGAKVTDIAILVVAADDGVQPQTIEAISHARAANVPIVVAINKIDKPGCQPDRIKQQLSEHGLVPEEWGGDTPMVEVSALSQINLDGLLEMLLLVAELGELQANPDRAAKGTVIEANLDRARGPIATLLVQNGTLRLGDAIVAGSIFGRVKAMTDDLGQRMEEAGPSSAVQLLGLSEVPAAGDEFEVYADEREARRVADQRQEDQRQARLQQMLSRRVSLGTVSAQAQEGQLKDLNLIIKTDVQGSAEAILSSLQQLSQEEVQLRVLLAAPGEITETDVDLAAASEAIIIGFATDASGGARLLADRYGVDIREYNIIYNLLEDITGAMEGLLDPEQVEEPLGQAEVRQVITIGRGNIAGCYVLSGKLLRNTPVRILRRGSVIFEGRLDSLKRFKDDVREVASGFECGIGVDKFTDWTEGDIIDAYQLVMKRRSLATASTNRR